MTGPHTPCGDMLAHSHRTAPVPPARRRPGRFLGTAQAKQAVQNGQNQVVLTPSAVNTALSLPGLFPARGKRVARPFGACDARVHA